MSKVRVAGIQLAPGPDVEKNLYRTGILLELAAGEESKIVALPQLFNTRWFPAAIDRKNFALAEKEDGKSISFIREKAAKHGLIIVAPIFEEDKGNYFNTAFVIGANGETIGKYRKMHVPQIPLWEERAYFKPGDLGFPVFKTAYGNIGALLCWDIFFPESFRMLAIGGAQIVFAPTASAFTHSQKKWERAIRAASHSNGIFVFRVNRTGKEEKQEFYGRSFCAGPDGEYVNKPSGPSAGVVLADIDIGEVGDTRNEWTFLNDRRPEEYKRLSESKE